MTGESDAARVADHLREVYGVRPGRSVALDHGVFRVDCADGRGWVARVFPIERAYSEVEGDAEILRALERGRFPAERCAHENPVSRFDGRAVLVTEFIDGARPERGGRIFAVLGTLLGALHARAGEGLRTGGGWHHLAPQGGPRDEIDGAIGLLERRVAELEATEAAELDRLIDELDATVDCAGLPQSFVHPDFVPVNAIVTPDGATTIIDWAGSGRGPRLWSLAFLLYATGGHPKSIELVVSRYRKHVQLQAEELDLLAAVLRARPLLLDCWAVGHGRMQPADAVRGLPSARARADAVATIVHAAFVD